MKVLLVASAAGGSLAPLADADCPALLPVAGKPVVIHALEAIAAAGLFEVVLAVRPSDTRIRAVVGDGSNWGVDVRYVLAGDDRPVASLLERLDQAGSDDLLVVHGGVFRSPGIVAAMVERAQDDIEAHLAAQVGGVWAGVDVLRPGALAAELPDAPGEDQGWRSSGAACEIDGDLFLLDTFRSYYDANVKAAAGAIAGIGVPGVEARTGLHTGTLSSVPPSAVSGAHVFAGASVRVHPSASLGDQVVLSDNVIVDRDVVLERTVVLPHTYVGRSARVSGAIIEGATLIRVDEGSVTHVSDRFVMCDTMRSRAGNGWGCRAVGLLMLVLSMPLWVLAVLLSFAAAPRRPWRIVHLVGNRGDGTASDAAPFTSAEFAVPIPWLRYLPRLWAVVTGDLRLVGVCPFSADGAGSRAA
ncbi:MAG TPA: NDP-sugar synthase [Vicinamibacterales bacterium]|jgi:mannose-1-phosphate guanylyltransferase/phosphomannomutase|nr:NDP-sugar synthase [Vicinamibacterales bacterium]